MRKNSGGGRQPEWEASESESLVLYLETQPLLVLHVYGDMQVCIFQMDHRGPGTLDRVLQNLLERLQTKKRRLYCRRSAV